MTTPAPTITLRDALARLHWKSWASLLSIIVPALAATFLGGAAANHKPALFLDSPFDMRIMVENTTNDFGGLTLIADTAPSPTPQTRVYEIRQVLSPFDILPIGKLHAQHFEEGVWQRLFDAVQTTGAVAGEVAFNWNGHENDGRYKEERVSKYLIHRYYLSDKCVLAYNVDDGGRSIPSSFRWINRTH